MFSPVGCAPEGEAPLVVATSWPLAARTEVEAIVREETNDSGPIVWVERAPSERLATVVNRRGAVDLVLGISGSADSLLLGPRRSIRRPITGSRSTATPPTGYGDPRDDPASLAEARSTLLAKGWAKGYEGLVRRASWSRPTFEAVHLDRADCVALVRGGKNPDRAGRFLLALESRGLAGPSSVADMADALYDGLLADLLGAALVDAHEELRDAEMALRRFGHPSKAEVSIGDRPPWPPASVAKLLAGPEGVLLVETLAEQISPDPESRAWLMESWSKPKRPIDGALLAELAGAVDGRLAREPRFRAWLRGEWTAWTRQHYRRVARVAGGYVPS